MLVVVTFLVIVVREGMMVLVNEIIVIDVNFDDAGDFYCRCGGGCYDNGRSDGEGGGGTGI